MLILTFSNSLSVSFSEEFFSTLIATGTFTFLVFSETSGI